MHCLTTASQTTDTGAPPRGLCGGAADSGARSARFNLWYLDTLVVHNKRLVNVEPSPSGSYTFLETAELEGN